MQLALIKFSITFLASTMAPASMNILTMSLSFRLAPRWSTESFMGSLAYWICACVSWDSNSRHTFKLPASMAANRGMLLS